MEKNRSGEKTLHKNWFTKHPILWTCAIILGTLFLIGFINGIINGITGNENNRVGSGQVSDNNVAKEPTKTGEIKQYITEDLDELWLYFVSMDSPYTDLQKEEKFKQYDGKLIKDSGIISSVDDGLFGGINVGLMSPDNPYLREATLYFDENQKSRLLNYNQYEEVNFEGKVDDYSSFLGIMIKDAKLQ